MAASGGQGAIQGTFDEAAGDGEGFSGPQVCDVVGITYRQLDYWDRTDLLKPSLSAAHGSGTQRRYSYRDLVQLKIIKRLLDAGMKLQTARTAIESLRREHGVDWHAASLVLDGGESVLVRDGDALFDLVRRGQAVLNVVALGPMVGELDAAIHELRPKTDAPASTNGERRTAEGG